MKKSETKVPTSLTFSKNNVCLWVDVLVQASEAGGARP
jgi:hypothetical protein